MTTVAFIRHAATAWNAEQRMQGRRDVPLTAASREALTARCLGARLRERRWFVSPLARARETARLLEIPEPTVEPRLAEMHWGEWEGERLADLRARFGGVMRVNEARGLDFRPRGGESPRDVRRRLSAWLRETALTGGPVGAVTHKGVIRVALALATGWDMHGRIPVPLDWDCAHIFRRTAEGGLVPEEYNVPLEAS